MTTGSKPIEGKLRLSVDWEQFGQSIRAQAIVDALHISTVGQRLGLSHARMVNAAQGKPVGTEIFLTLCHWMQQDPMHFTRALTKATDTENERG